MIKNFILTAIISVFLITNSYSAGSSSSSGDGGSMKSNYEKAVSFIKSAKKLERVVCKNSSQDTFTET